MQNKENINAKNSESQKHIETLEKALALFADSGKQDTNLLKQIIILLTRTPLYFPIEIDMDAMFSGIDPTTLKAGDTFSPDQDVKIIIRTLMVPDDEQPEEVIPAFTSLEEANKGPQSSFMQMYPQEYLRTVSQMGKPVVINLFGKTLLYLRPKVFQEILPDLMNDSFGGKSEMETSRQCGNVDKDGADAQRYCAQCGHVIHKNARFCTNCGKTVSNKSESASPKPVGVGAIIDGKYELLKMIGQGGTFKVFLAMDVRLNKIWAVKILRDDYQNADYETQGMLRKIALHEATLLQDLNHPAIPNIVDIIDVPGFFATVQEYVEGDTLNEIMKTCGAQPVDLVMDWAKQLCDVLAYLHALNPPHIHRDIKPNNLILTPNGRIKIIDFGIMRTYKPAQKNDTCSLGTKGYAAPEQYGGRGQTDARTDIYGVGMTLYCLLTGLDPKEENFVVRPLCQVNPALPKGIEYIIDKCIQLNPKDRYQNCTDLLNDLNHYTELPR